MDPTSIDTLSIVFHILFCLGVFLKIPPDFAAKKSSGTLVEIPKVFYARSYQNNSWTKGIWGKYVNQTVDKFVVP